MKDQKVSEMDSGIEIISSMLGSHVATIMAQYLCGVKRDDIPMVTARAIAEFILEKKPPEDPAMIDSATTAVEMCILDVMRAILQDLEGGPKPDYSMN